jgi:hypothetical protein
LRPEEQWIPSITLGELLNQCELPQKKEYVEPFCSALRYQFLAWTSSEFEFTPTFAALVKHSEEKKSPYFLVKQKFGGPRLDFVRKCIRET